MTEQSPQDRHVYLEDIPLEEAQARLRNALQKAGKWGELSGEKISLSEALDRVTSESVWARISSPHYHAAAMDGYAVLAKDTLHATETRPLKLTLDATAFPVNTGDPLPPQTNAVIMIEHVQHIDTDHIEIRGSVAPWQHVRPLGEDMVATELVLPINHRIRPVDLGAIAGCGHHEVHVRRKPQVMLIPTGNELIPPTQEPQAGQIIEYNSLVLAAQIQQSGGIATITDIIPDDIEQISIALEQALQQSPDLVLILSGSSAGSRDYTAAVIREQGELLVHGVAVRPGHPVIVGIADKTPVIGIPGYPVSAALTGEIFVQPLLNHWLGMEAESKPSVQATMTRKVISHTGDDDFLRVALAQVGERLLATPLSRGAGVITSLVRADGLAHIPRFSEGVGIGESVDIQLYRSLSVIKQTILVMGSHDPMLDLLGQTLANDYPSFRLVSGHVGSLGGLVSLRRDEAHLAGAHLLDSSNGEYNVSYIQQYLPNLPLKLITFAHREQGLIVAKGNPLAIQSLDDLPRVRYVNRQRGSGTRVLLDYELEKRDISSETISGYLHEEYTHLGVAAAVASNVADCGLGLRTGAIAMDLDFISIGWERYDFVIPEKYMPHSSVQHLISILHDKSFKALLSSQDGYRVLETGKVQFTQ